MHELLKIVFTSCDIHITRVPRADQTKCDWRLTEHSINLKYKLNCISSI